MTKLSAYRLLLLLGLAVLGGCQRAEMPEEQREVHQVTGQPVKVSLTLDIRGFGSDGVLTKGDYEDVDAALRYDYERDIVNYAIYVFDATGAFKDDGKGKYIFDPTQTKRLSADEEAIAYKEHLRELTWRHELKLSKDYKSLAVLVLANLGRDMSPYTAAGIPGEGSTLQAVADYFNQKTTAIVYETDQAKYTSADASVKVCIPMYGFQVFGSWEGLATTSSAADKDKRELKYYSGIATPLTVKGFRTQEELTNYTTSGAVRAEDRLTLRFSLARLHVSYNPASGQPAATPASGVASVEITGVQLKYYDRKVRVLPPIFSAVSEINPFTTTIPGPLDLEDNLTDDPAKNIKFVHPKAGDLSWVAYVPEMKVTGADKDPRLIVDVKVTDTKGNVVYYTFDRDKVRRNDGTNNKTYENSPWTDWLQMRTYYSRKDPDNNDVNIGTYFNLVRNYTYEWIAEGVDGMKL